MISTFSCDCVLFSCHSHDSHFSIRIDFGCYLSLQENVGRYNYPICIPKDRTSPNASEIISHGNREHFRAASPRRLLANPPSASLLLVGLPNCELCDSRYVSITKSDLGLGTVISSWTDVEYHGWDWAVFITGILQFGLAWIIIGWAWSIWWGVRMFQDAQERKRKEEQALEGRAAPATEAESRSVNRPSTQSEEPLTVHVSQEAAE